MINIHHYKIAVFTAVILFAQIHSEEPAPLTLSCPGETYTESIIYNPERSKYSTGGTAIPTTKKEDCPFCKKLASNKLYDDLKIKFSALTFNEQKGTIPQSSVEL